MMQRPDFWLFAAGIFVFGCGLSTGCYRQNQNVIAKQVLEPDSPRPLAKSALMVANLISKGTSKPEYCVLQVQGVSGPDLLDKKFAGVRNVVAVHGSSISMDNVTELKTPELRKGCVECQGGTWHCRTESGVWLV